jgi:hypothetical protein
MPGSTPVGDVDVGKLYGEFFVTAALPTGRSGVVGLSTVADVSSKDVKPGVVFDIFFP